MNHCHPNRIGLLAVLILVGVEAAPSAAPVPDGSYLATESWSFTITYPDGHRRSGSGTESGVILISGGGSYSLLNRSGVPYSPAPTARTLVNSGGSQYTVTGDYPVRYFSAASPTVLYLPLTAFVVPVQLEGDGVNYSLFNPSALVSSGALGTLTAGINGNVSYQGQNATFSAYSTTSLTASGGAPVIEQTPQPLVLQAGGSGMLSVLASGAPPLAYQWSRDGVDIPGATGSQYAFASFAASQSGTYRIRVSNGQGTTTSAPTSVALGGQVVVSYTNASPISLDPNAYLASPYPAAITVSGQPGSLTKVRATLRNLSITTARSADILMVGPGGQNVLLMSDVSYWRNKGVSGATLTFDDAAAASLPGSGSSDILTGTYRPSDYRAGLFADTFPAPAPQLADGQHGSLLSAFNGLNPNGTWSLYAVTVDDPGQIAGGWSLELTFTVPVVVNQPPTLSALTDQLVSPEGTTGPLPFTISDPETAAGALTLAATSSDTLLVPVGGVSFGGSAGSRTVTVTPAAGRTGFARITVTVSDGTNTAAQTFNLTVAQVPAFAIHPTNLTVFRTNVASVMPATFSATATGTPPLSYQWFLNGNALTNATNATLVLPDGRFAMEGSYHVRVSNIGGSSLSSNATLTVRSPRQLSSLQRRVDGTVQLTLTDPDATPFTAAHVARFEVQVCTNLATAVWIPLPTALTATNGALTLSDADGPLHPRRFYRVVEK